MSLGFDDSYGHLRWHEVKTLIEQRGALEAMSALVLASDEGFVVRAHGGTTIDTKWFVEHKGHKLVPIDADCHEIRENEP